MDTKPISGEIYTHYKTGNNYKILATALHSETLEEMVVYECLYDNPKSKVWVRPLEMFMGEVEKDGKKLMRFSKNSH